MKRNQMVLPKSQKGLTLIELIIIVFFIVVVVSLPVIIYVGGSLVTSGVKAATDNCGETYGAESMFDGDWFCPVQDQDD